MPMSPERAEQIRKITWAYMQGREWSCALPEITVEEDREVREYWEEIEGATSFYDAVSRMANGEHLHERAGIRVDFEFLGERLFAIRSADTRPVDAVTRSISRRLGKIPVTLISGADRHVEYETFWAQWYNEVAEEFRESEVRIYKIR